MCRLDVEREVHTEIVRDAYTVSFRIEEGSRSDGMVIVLRYRHGLRASGAVVHIERGTVTLGKLIVTHELEVMRLVVLGWIPFAVVHRTDDALVALSEFGSGVGIANPSVQLAFR